MPIFIENREHLHVAHIKTLLRKSDQACFALAFIRHSGVDLIKAEIESLIKRRGSIRVLFANDFGATDSSAVEALQEIGADLKFYSDAISFHPKTFIFKTRKGLWAIVGSSNLSASGLSQGTEWRILLSPDDMDCAPILTEFNRMWNSVKASEVTEEVLSRIAQQDQRPEIRETLRKQDQYPRKASSLSKDKVLVDGNNYIVRAGAERLDKDRAKLGTGGTKTFARGAKDVAGVPREPDAGDRNRAKRAVQNRQGVADETAASRGRYHIL